MHFREQKRLLSEEIYLLLMVYLSRTNAEQHFESPDRARQRWIYVSFGH